METIVYLSLGSNLGDRINNLRVAVSHFGSKIHPLIQSSLYESEPWGYSDQPDFINQVIKAESRLAPLDLLAYVKDIEKMMGRKATFRFGPRLIDLDILFYDELIMDTPNLTIPHPRIAERAFVLVPLAEIAPDLVHPSLGKSILDLKSSVDTSGIKLIQPATS